MKHTKYVSLFARIIISVGIIFYLLKTLQTHVFLETIKTLSVLVILRPICVDLFNQGIASTRWLFISSSMDIQGSVLSFYRYYLIGIFACQFLPTTVGGDMGRSLLVSREKSIPFIQPFLSIFYERLTGLVGLFLLLALAQLMLKPTYLPSYVFIVFLFLTLLTWVFTVQLRHFHNINWLKRITEKVVFSKKSKSSSTTQWPPAKVLLLAALASIIVHVVTTWNQVFIFKALGLDISFWLVMLVYGLSNLFALIPISFNGIGVREGASVTLFMLWGGVSQEIAVTFSLIWLSVLVLTSIPGGFYFLIMQWKGIPELDLMNSNKKIPDDSLFVSNNVST